MAIKCVMFDCGNVLIWFNNNILYDFIDKHRRNCREPSSIFTGPIRHIIADYDLDAVSDKDFFLAVKDAFALEDVTEEEFFHIATRAIIVPDWTMIGIRDELKKRGLATVLVSNMNRFHLNYLRNNCPWVVSGFDYSLVSCDAKIAKPNPEAWIRPLDFMGLKAEECLFIDDVYENIGVAGTLGIKGWHYNVKDSNFLSTGRLREERKKFNDFIELIWNRGILKPL